MPTVRQDRDFRDIVREMIGDSVLQEAIDYISSNLDPDEVFDEKDLKNWAESNGYIKE